MYSIICIILYNAICNALHNINYKIILKSFLIKNRTSFTFQNILSKYELYIQRARRKAVHRRIGVWYYRLTPKLYAVTDRRG